MDVNVLMCVEINIFLFELNPNLISGRK